MKMWVGKLFVREKFVKFSPRKLTKNSLFPHHRTLTLPATINSRSLTCLLDFITLSLVVVDLTSSAQLRCKFREHDVVWQKYCCVVEALSVDNQTSTVTSISGTHTSARMSDKSVQTLTIENIQTFQYFTSDLFAKFSDLRNLIVHNSSLELLRVGDFEFAANLANVHIAHNPLRRLPNFAFYGASKLKSLNLRNNRIRIIESDAFASIFYLKYLVLSYNEIKSLNVDLFRDLTYLEELSLSGNQIMHIHETQFVRNTHLRVLFVSWNQIKTLNGNIFKHTKELRELYMDNNQLRRFGTTSFFLAELEHLEIATFDNNTCVNTNIIVPQGVPVKDLPFDRIFERCMGWRRWSFSRSNAKLFLWINFTFKFHFHFQHTLYRLTQRER